MKQCWEIHKLHFLVTRLTNGYVGQTKNIYLTTGIPYLLARHVKNNVLTFDGKTFVSDQFNFKNKKSILKEGDVLLVQSGHIGHSAVVPKEHEGHNCHAMIVMTPKSDLISGAFLSLYFLTPYMQLKFESLKTGSTIKHLNCKVVREIEIPLPPLPEQQRIVSVLDKAFAAIDKAKANAEQNLKNAKELFESYLQSVFENKGNGWVEKTLGDVCEFRNGAAHEQHIDVNGKYILVNSKFISADGEKMKRTNSALAPLFVNDIAFVMSDVPKGKALAKCFLVDKNDTYTLNQRIGAIKSKVFIPEFLIYQFNRNKYLLSFDNGENQTNLRKGDILDCPLFVPSKEQQQAIVHQLDALRDEAQKLEVIYKKKIEDLEELKKSILQKAFNGELDTTKDIAV